MVRGKRVANANPTAIEALKTGNRVVVIGIAAVVGILFLAALLLFLNLPDANAFNTRVEQIFVKNDALTTADQIKLLEILAQSGTAFSDVLASYRSIIFVLLLFATALLILRVTNSKPRRGLSWLKRMPEVANKLKDSR